MKFYLGVTDNNWFDYLSRQNREDINFWQPGGQTNFMALSPGEPFLFKLKSPINKIAGVGFFSSFTKLPINMAWEVFGQGNGCANFNELRGMIARYRNDDINLNPIIGCIVLTNPIFFDKKDWIDTPSDFSKSIVQGKGYPENNPRYSIVWKKVELLLIQYLYHSSIIEENQFTLQDEGKPNEGYREILSRIRIGQGAFRVMVTDAYQRRCAISGEKTLPVLEAAHIKSYASAGPQTVSNAMLLRSDIHKLFDSGYLTVTTDLKIEVSNRIKEEFQNGKDYYKFHGNNLMIMPTGLKDKPHSVFLEWHNENIYRG